jgi:8-oxo-dGTP pyrophosphatase MutT (NUDIX family)
MPDAPRRRVACYVTRTGPAGTELLVFDHVDFPDAGTQVPAGGIEPGEAVPAAALREVAEEAGLTAVEYVGELGGSHAPHPETGAAQQTTYVHCRTADPRGSWDLRVTGGGEDEGLRFRCWFTPLPLDGVRLLGDQAAFLAHLP